VTLGLTRLPGCHGYDRAWFASDATARVIMVAVELVERKGSTSF